jgi:predicted nucleic-acid-binding protein
VKKPAKSLPDTNTIVRYLVKDDLALFAKAESFFDQVRNGIAKAVILESVVAECIYVLTKIYKVPREKAAESLIAILHYKGIANEDRNDLIRALTLFSEQNIDIVDCILCEKAAKAKAPLFSFDKELNKVMDSRTKK